MRKLKILIVAFAVSVLLFQTPLATIEYGLEHCHCVSMRAVFQECDSFCNAHMSYCTGTELYGDSQCIMDQCAATYMIYCNNGESNLDWFWKDCPEQCEPPTE